MLNVCLKKNVCQTIIWWNIILYNKFSWIYVTPNCLKILYIYKYIYIKK